jgi:hypothetical protein
MCQALFIYPTQTSEGKISFFTISDPGPTGVTATISDANYIKAIQSQSYSTSRRVRRTIVQLLKTIGYSKYRRKMIDIDFADRIGQRYPWASEDLEIDAGWFGDPVVQQVDDTLLRAFEGINLARYMVIWDRLPEYEMVVEGSISDVAVGDVVNVTDNVLIDADGEPGVDARCVVISKEKAFGDRSMRIRVLDLSPISGANSVVCPSWEVDSVANVREFTIVGKEFTDDDIAQWKDNYKYLLYDKYGTLRSTDGPVDGTINMSGDVLLSSAWTASSSSVTPNPGDVVRVAQYDDATNWKSDGYVWLADSDAVLGTGDDDPARWA